MKFTGEHLKKAVIILLVVMSISFIIAGIAAFVGLAGDKKNQTHINAERTFDLDSLKRINVKTISTDIHVKPSPDDKVRVSLVGHYSKDSGIKLDTSKSGSTLHVILRRKLFRFSLFNFHKKMVLQVFVPQEFVQKLELETTSGEIFFNESKARDIALKTISGDITVEECAPEKIKIDTTSGEITGDTILAEEVKVKTTSGGVSLKNITGKFTCDAVSADINVSYAEFGAPVKIETISGDVELNLGHDAAVKVDFSSISGDFDSDLPLSISHKSKKSFKAGTDDDGVKIDVETTSGDFKLRK